MEVLSHDVFVNTLEKCNALPRYKVGFCFATNRDAKQFAESVKELFVEEDIPGVKQVWDYGSCGSITFNSDSVIDIFSIANSRGKRFNDLFWSEDVEYHREDFEHLILQAVPYHGIPVPEVKRYDWTDYAESEALDEFFISLELGSQEV